MNFRNCSINSNQLEQWIFIPVIPGAIARTVGVRAAAATNIQTNKPLLKQLTPQQSALFHNLNHQKTAILTLILTAVFSLGFISCRYDCVQPTEDEISVLWIRYEFVRVRNLPHFPGYSGFISLSDLAKRIRIHKHCEIWVGKSRVAVSKGARDVELVILHNYVLNWTKFSGVQWGMGCT